MHGKDRVGIMRLWFIKIFQRTSATSMGNLRFLLVLSLTLAPKLATDLVCLRPAYQFCDNSDNVKRKIQDLTLNWFSHTTL
jgi:hypothetical protein